MVFVTNTFVVVIFLVTGESPVYFLYYDSDPYRDSLFINLSSRSQDVHDWEKVPILKILRIYFSNSWVTDSVKLALFIWASESLAVSKFWDSSRWPSFSFVPFHSLSAFRRISLVAIALLVAIGTSHTYSCTNSSGDPLLIQFGRLSVNVND